MYKTTTPTHTHTQKNIVWSQVYATIVVVYRVYKYTVLQRHRKKSILKYSINKSLCMMENKLIDKSLLDSYGSFT